MDEKLIEEKLEKHLDLSNTLITRANRYFKVIEKICKNTQEVQLTLAKIYAYNPEAKIYLEDLLKRYQDSLEEQAEAVQNMANSFEETSNFWQELLSIWKSEILD